MILMPFVQVKHHIICIPSSLTFLYNILFNKEKISFVCKGISEINGNTSLIQLCLLLAIWYKCQWCKETWRSRIAYHRGCCILFKETFDSNQGNKWCKSRQNTAGGIQVDTNGLYYSYWISCQTIRTDIHNYRIKRIR